MMSGDDKHPFRPPVYLRNNMLQTFLGSKRPGFFQNRPLVTAAKTVLLSTKKGIRLKGAFSLSESKKVRGLVMLLHGWEGSITSKYILSAGQRLMNCGFNVFRLNFRDHGGTHHLNDGLFYSTLLNEVYDALAQAARMIPKQPVFLCGFSLGGNFALRIARKYSRTRPNSMDLRHILAISPVLNPSRATDAIDQHPVIRRYFMKKWKRSLSIKQRLFPQLYNFNDIMALPTIRQMTEALVVRYSHFSSTEEYFAGYTISNSQLKEICIPTTLVTSKDDPVIPVSDFFSMSPNRYIHLIIHSYGGHNGFLKNLCGRTWCEDYMDQTFAVFE
jgi:predicted alpha/beta-fold hydrolase